MLHKFFLKRFRQYFLKMLIPMLLVFSISFGILISQGIKEARTSARHTLENMSMNIKNTIENPTYQIDLMTMNSKFSKSFSNILTGVVKEYSDIVTMNMLKSTLNGIVDADDYLHSIYLSLNQHAFFFSSRDGLREISTYHDNTWRSDSLKLQNRKDVLVKKRTVASPQGGTEVISVFWHMLLLKGTIVINLDTSAFARMLSRESSPHMGMIYVQSGSQEILIEHDNTAYAKPVPDDLHSFLGKNGSLPESRSGQWVTINNTHYLYSFSRYENLQLTFISLIPLSDLLILHREYLYLFAIILFTNCLVVALLAYSTTKRVFRQIYYMVDLFADADRGIFPKAIEKKADDEYDVIMNNILHMFLNTTHLNTLLAEKQYRKELAERMTLQLQINPHFLFNTLQTIDFQVQKEQSDKLLISRMIQDLSGILKYSLTNPIENVTLAQDLNYLKSYVHIQRVRFGDRFVIYYEIDPYAMNARVFSLMLQPLVENSILHGIRYLNKRGFIRIRATVQGETLLISVLDNGIGMDEAQRQAVMDTLSGETTKSIGLTNVHRRLLLNFGEGCGLCIRSQKGIGTRVFFTIPYLPVKEMNTNPNS